jgi:hypothetical protein
MPSKKSACGPVRLSSRTRPYPTAVKVDVSISPLRLSSSSSPTRGRRAGVMPGVLASTTAATSNGFEMPPGPEKP